MQRIVVYTASVYQYNEFWYVVVTEGGFTTHVDVMIRGLPNSINAIIYKDELARFEPHQRHRAGDAPWAARARYGPDIGATYLYDVDLLVEASYLMLAVIDASKGTWISFGLLRSRVSMAVTRLCTA
jgi:hypothetical protein